MTRYLVTFALAALLVTPSAEASLNLSRFSVVPSTTQAGGHPNLSLAVAFAPATSDVREIRLHLPAGLTANAGAAPFCSRPRLVADLCDLRTKVGTLRLVGEAFGFEAEAQRNIYNVKPAGGERLRLGLPVFGSASRGGVALMLPVIQRPDGGLDIAVAGPPREVAGYPIGINEVDLNLRGSVRARIKRKLRKRALLTNPRSCTPASTVLELTAQIGPPPSLTQVSSFTPTGC
jgi:hypothetical protein